MFRVHQVSVQGLLFGSPLLSREITNRSYSGGSSCYQL